MSWSRPRLSSRFFGFPFAGQGFLTVACIADAWRTEYCLSPCRSIAYRSPAQVTAETCTTDDKLQQLLLGQSIYLDRPELGAQGLTQVRGIDPRPSLDAADSGRHLVTGTFRHTAD
jgi:hypothetical protein